jgi:hypothetical protein
MSATLHKSFRIRTRPCCNEWLPGPVVVWRYPDYGAEAGLLIQGHHQHQGEAGHLLVLRGRDVTLGAGKEPLNAMLLIRTDLVRIRIRLVLFKLLRIGIRLRIQPSNQPTKILANFYVDIMGLLQKF